MCIGCSLLPEDVHQSQMQESELLRPEEFLQASCCYHRAGAGGGGLNTAEHGA